MNMKCDRAELVSYPDYKIFSTMKVENIEVAKKWAMGKGDFYFLKLFLQKTVVKVFVVYPDQIIEAIKLGKHDRIQM